MPRAAAHYPLYAVTLVAQGHRLHFILMAGRLRREDSMMFFAPRISSRTGAEFRTNTSVPHQWEDREALRPSCRHPSLWRDVFVEVIDGLPSGPARALIGILYCRHPPAKSRNSLVTGQRQQARSSSYTYMPRVEASPLEPRTATCPGLFQVRAVPAAGRDVGCAFTASRSHTDRSRRVELHQVPRSMPVPYSVDCLSRNILPTWVGL